MYTPCCVVLSGGTQSPTEGSQWDPALDFFTQNEVGLGIR